MELIHPADTSPEKEDKEFIKPITPSNDLSDRNTPGEESSRKPQNSQQIKTKINNSSKQTSSIPKRDRERIESQGKQQNMSVNYLKKNLIFEQKFWEKYIFKFFEKIKMWTKKKIK